MAERKDKRVEFHARSAEHKKQFEAILEETGQTKSEFFRACMDRVVSGRDDDDHAGIVIRDAKIARLEGEIEVLSAALFTKDKALKMTRDELTGIRAEKFRGLTRHSLAISGGSGRFRWCLSHRGVDGSSGYQGLGQGFRKAGKVGEFIASSTSPTPSD
jgi:hypothetical protein